MTKGMFDGEVENNYKPMPVGTYSGKVVKVEFKVSQNGNEMIQIEFVLNENQRHLWTNIMWFNDQMMGIAKGKLEQLGFTRDERKELDPDDHDVFLSAIKYMVADKTYDIKVGLDKEGNNNIKYVSDQNAVEIDPLDPLSPAPSMTSSSKRLKNPFDK